ncbi:type II toxin-antitoxin system Phd/YefM family antitoxin [Calditrichota bacterium LG25]
MRTINFEQDIKSLSEFRANASKLLKQVNNTRRPLIITQHGKSKAVLMSVTDYQNLIEKLEILEDIYVSEKQIAEGKGIPHNQVKEELLKRFK